MLDSRQSLMRGLVNTLVWSEMEASQSNPAGANPTKVLTAIFESKLDWLQSTLVSPYVKRGTKSSCINKANSFQFWIYTGITLTLNVTIKNYTKHDKQCYMWLMTICFNCKDGMLLRKCIRKKKASIARVKGNKKKKSRRT